MLITQIKQLHILIVKKASPGAGTILAPAFSPIFERKKKAQEGTRLNYMKNEN